MGAHHDHHHGPPADSSRGRLALAFGLNLAFTLIELVGAYFTNSAAIAALAVHDLGDSLALGFAWAMQGVAGKSKDATYSYGFRRLSLGG